MQIKLDCEEKTRRKTSGLDIWKSTELFRKFNLPENILWKHKLVTKNSKAQLTLLWSEKDATVLVRTLVKPSQ